MLSIQNKLMVDFEGRGMDGVGRLGVTIFSNFKRFSSIIKFFRSGQGRGGEVCFGAILKMA